MKCLFCPILIISLFIFISGCGEDPEPELIPGEPPKVVSTVPTEGGGQGGNVPVTFTLNNALAEATVSGADGTTEIRGKMVVFWPSPSISPGSVTLTLTGKDASGQEIIYSLTFTVFFDELKIPLFVRGDCRPVDGAVNVDPREYSNGLVVAFDEKLSFAEITSTKPEFNYILTIDGDKVMIEFVDYTMPYETRFVIGITVKNPPGNQGDVIYSFTTMAKTGM